MTKSRMAIALLFAAALLGESAADAAPPPGDMPGDRLTAEQALDTYHRRFELAGQGRCSVVAVADELVVCGRRPLHPDRVPFPDLSEPGEIVHHAGEAGGGGGALTADGCTRLCEQPLKVDLLQAAAAVPKIVRHILHGDD
jgi:hypothetical protein